MKSDKKVGIIGGTFNPIHLGHLILAEYAYDEYQLDEILFIPTGISYFKDPNTVLDKKRKEIVLTNNLFVGATGFEPAAAWSQTRSATGLRYTPFCKAQEKNIKVISDLRVQRYALFLNLANFIINILLAT